MVAVSGCRRDYGPTGSQLVSVAAQLTGDLVCALINELRLDETDNVMLQTRDSVIASHCPPRRENAGNIKVSGTQSGR